jgi:hypothetical protein
MAFEPLVSPATHFLFLVTVFGLQRSLELLIVTLDLQQIVVGEFTPLLFELAFKLSPSTLELIFVHKSSFFFRLSFFYFSVSRFATCLISWLHKGCANCGGGIITVSFPKIYFSSLLYAINRCQSFAHKWKKKTDGMRHGYERLSDAIANPRTIAAYLERTDGERKVSERFSSCDQIAEVVLGLIDKLLQATLRRTEREHQYLRE